MEGKIIHHLLKKMGATDLAEMLADKISGTALNSLLLQVFHQKTAQLRPADILRSYAENRFVRPSSAAFFALQNIKQGLLEMAHQAGFEPLQLSPVCPLGACSAVGLTHQDKVLSALRGTEVVADATNVLALETALRRKKSRPTELLQFCAAHRHLRTQVVDIEGFTPHFEAFCMTTAGRDTGSFDFEKTAFRSHIGFYHAWAKSLPDFQKFHLVLTPFSVQGLGFCEHALAEGWPEGTSYELRPFGGEKAYYYQFLRAKILVTLGGREFEVGDCGFTNWTARLLQDEKERFFISGIGVEFLAKMVSFSD